uniref:Uncharacterized protein n=1 Tax=Anguilla anguilla TaxID=7936 RepID=A0A0E9PXK3_ANGAN
MENIGQKGNYMQQPQFHISAISQNSVSLNFLT